MYVVLAKESPSIQALQNLGGVQEKTSTADGERLFVIRRDLKKD